jgi:hypothetical protein
LAAGFVDNADAFPHKAPRARNHLISKHIEKGESSGPAAATLVGLSERSRRHTDALSLEGARRHVGDFPVPRPAASAATTNFRRIPPATSRPQSKMRAVVSSKIREVCRRRKSHHEPQDW